MPTKLIEGRFVAIGTESAGGVALLTDTSVVVADHSIVAIGPTAEMAARFPDAQRLGSPDHVILPGLVNAHHHVGLTPIQLGVHDDPLELWFITRMASRDVDPYLDTLYSSFEMLRSGVTTVQHIVGLARGGDLDGLAKRLDATLQAYQDVGMRVSMAMPIRDQNFFTYEPAEELLARLPAALSERTRRLIDGMAVPVAEQLALFQSFADRYAGHPRIRVQLAPANLHWLSDDALGAVADCAARTGVPMHIHLVETVYQHLYAKRRTGGTALKHLSRFGLACPQLTIGHGTWMEAGDIELAAATGVHVCHNCSSNFRLRSGIAPLQAFLGSGLNVAVGIDEAGINDDRDMLQEMRLILHAHRTPGMQAHSPQPADILVMASAGGARTTPFGRRIGALVPGRAADMVALRWSKVIGPYLDEAMPPLDALLHRATSAAVDLVLVDGEVVVRNGEIALVDRTRALDELRRSLALPLAQRELERRTLAADLLPFVRGYYARVYDPEVRRDAYRQANLR